MSSTELSIDEANLMLSTLFGVAKMWLGNLESVSSRLGSLVCWRLGGDEVVIVFYHTSELLEI